MTTLNINRMLRQIAKVIGLSCPIIVPRSFLMTFKEFPYTKGIAFERTGRRNSLYLWNVIIPSFDQGSQLLLNFSERLNDGYTLDGSEEEIVATSIACILNRPGLLASLLAGEAPSDFLDRYPVPVEYPEHAPAVVVFDLAASAALAGRTETAIRLIIALRNRTNYVPDETITRHAETLLSTIEQGLDVTSFLKAISDDHKKF